MIKPTDDFFAYVNGAWVKENPIPPTESRWGSFYILRTEVEKQLKTLLDGLVERGDAPPDETARKVRDFYKSGMDAAHRNALGKKPLEAVFKLVDAIKEPRDIARVAGYLHRHGVGAWWAPSAEPDMKKSDVVAFYLYQSGLSLPDRDYYLNDDEKSATIRVKFEEYAKTMAEGTLDPSVPMGTETELARASMTRVELRDVEKQYHKKSGAELKALTPHIDWDVYFDEIGVPMPADIIVCQPDFLVAVDRMFAETAIEDHKHYLKWHILNGMAGYLNEELEARVFDFYGRTFTGATEMKPQWRRVLMLLNRMLGEAVGKLYVEKHFSEDARKKVRELVDHLTHAYRARIGKLEWMGEETKRKALVKLAAITRKLGYPDKWLDISALEMDGSSYAENYIRAYRFEFDRQMKKVGGPVDRSEWHSPPQIVNAFYDPLMNEILFPAAILQPPFFDPAADDATNFGGIGTVIGHELTHGFDDQGALFDEKGNLENWWTEDDKKRFDGRTKRLEEQFDAYEALPGLRVNGKLTLGENIADLGGLVIAYDALMLLFAEKGRPAPVDGVTPEQRFFLGFAMAERDSAREEAVRLQVQTDPHSPSPFRLNGPVSNMDEFFAAYGGKPGDKLWRNPEDRVRIW